jgi:hypothetical protein
MKKIYLLLFWAFFLSGTSGYLNAQLCTGAPGSNSILPSSPTVCPNGTVNLSLANTYTNTGYSYQWYVSTVSGVGPFTTIGSATGTTYITPPATTTPVYYQVVITCTAPGGASLSVNTVVNMVNCVTGLQRDKGEPGLTGFYPNPAKGSIFIELANSTATQVKIIDMSGRILRDLKVSAALVELNIEDLSPGLYYLQLDAEHIYKVLIE